jgi:hypothetical protein
MNDKALDIFGPTIHTLWIDENYNLKKDLIDDLVILFGESFDKSGVNSLTCTNLRYVRD